MRPDRAIILLLFLISAQCAYGQQHNGQNRGGAQHGQMGGQMGQHPGQMTPEMHQNMMMNNMFYGMMMMNEMMAAEQQARRSGRGKNGSGMGRLQPDHGQPQHSQGQASFGMNSARSQMNRSGANGSQPVRPGPRASGNNGPKAQQQSQAAAHQERADGGKRPQQEAANRKSAEQREEAERKEREKQAAICEKERLKRMNDPNAITKANATMAVNHLRNAHRKLEEAVSVSDSGGHVISSMHHIEAAMRDLGFPMAAAMGSFGMPNIDPTSASRQERSHQILLEAKFQLERAQLSLRGGTNRVAHQGGAHIAVNEAIRQVDEARRMR